MIYDHLGNAARYRALHPSFARGFDYLAAFRADSFAPGREEIDGEALFVSRMEYTSKLRPAAKWESHRRYADIQFILDGEEQIAHAPASSLVTPDGYDEARDRTLYLDQAGLGQLLHYPAGWFGIFFPEDGHLPDLAVGEPARVRKILVKVRL